MLLKRKRLGIWVLLTYLCARNHCLVSLTRANFVGRMALTAELNFLKQLMFNLKIKL